MAALAAPGLIVYQIGRTKKETDEVEKLDSKAISELQAAMLVAALLAAATTQSLATAAGKASAGVAEAMAMAAALGAAPELEPDDQAGLIILGVAATLALSWLLAALIPAEAIGASVVLTGRALAALATLLAQQAAP
jgi:hypothetical protein